MTLINTAERGEVWSMGQDCGKSTNVSMNALLAEQTWDGLLPDCPKSCVCSFGIKDMKIKILRTIILSLVAFGC